MHSPDTRAVAALRRAIGHANIGSQTNLATLLSRELGRPFRQGHVSHWLKVGVPAAYCPTVEKLTDGAVKCEELAPEVDWAVLRTQPA